MKTLTSINKLPNVPSVYAMYGGKGRGAYVAYVGIADALKSRVIQHLVRRDSSVTTGTSAVSLNSDYVTEVRWWEHPDFNQRHVLQAAELVAFDVLNPVPRSRGGIQEQSKQLYADKSFQKKMCPLFSGEPAGRLSILSVQDAFQRITDLEQRVMELKKRLPKK